jgi:hypothetical protein
MKIMRQFLCLWLCGLLASPLLPSQAAFGEEHVVPPAELRQRLRAAGEARQRNLARFDRLLSREAVRGALRSTGLDAGQVRGAVAQLDDDELARLAARAEQVDRDIAGGALTNQQLTYIVIALATAVIILVIVAAD